MREMAMNLIETLPFSNLVQLSGEMKSQPQNDGHWVTVFGFPKELSGRAFEQMSRYGDITDHKIPPGNSRNWFYVRYYCIHDAERAAKNEDAELLTSDVMIGVKVRGIRGAGHFSWDETDCKPTTNQLLPTTHKISNENQTDAMTNSCDHIQVKQELESGNKDENPAPPNCSASPKTEQLRNVAKESQDLPIIERVESLCEETNEQKHDGELSQPKVECSRQLGHRVRVRPEPYPHNSLVGKSIGLSAPASKAQNRHANNHLQWAIRKSMKEVPGFKSLKNKDAMNQVIEKVKFLCPNLDTDNEVAKKLLKSRIATKLCYHNRRETREKLGANYKKGPYRRQGEKNADVLPPKCQLQQLYETVSPPSALPKPHKGDNYWLLDDVGLKLALAEILVWNSSQLVTEHLHRLDGLQESHVEVILRKVVRKQKLVSALKAGLGMPSVRADGLQEMSTRQAAVSAPEVTKNTPRISVAPAPANRQKVPRMPK